MRKNQLVMLIIVAFLPLVAFANEKTITCEELKGSRVDYFLRNNLDLENNKFIFGRDKINGKVPKLIINEDDSKVTFTFGDVVMSTDAKNEANKLTIVHDSFKQITMYGVLKNAPVLITYYHKLKVLLIVQQSVWDTIDYYGMRAMTLHARCK